MYMQRYKERKWMVNIQVIWVKNMQDFFVKFSQFFCKSDIKLKCKNKEIDKTNPHKTNKVSSNSKFPGSIL